MTLRIGKKYLLLLGAAVMLAAVIGVCKYTKLFRLREVKVNPVEHVGVEKKLQLTMDQNLFKVPVARAAETLLGESRVLKVDIDYALPDGITITINDIKPLAIVIGNNGKTLYSLDERGYLLPYDDGAEGFDYPLITGLKKTKQYARVTDRRLNLILDQLGLLKDDCLDFYLALSCIDLSKKDYVSVFLDGLPFRVDMYAGNLYTSIKDLEIFLLDFDPDLSEVARLDMRSDGLIISAG